MLKVGFAAVWKCTASSIVHISLSLTHTHTHTETDRLLKTNQFPLFRSRKLRRICGTNKDKEHEDWSYCIISFIFQCYATNIIKKVKLSLCSPGQALRAPEG